LTSQAWFSMIQFISTSSKKDFDIHDSENDISQDLNSQSNKTVKQSQSILVTSGKGGVGKTMVVANLAISMAMQGFRTCVVDADIGLRNLDIALGLEDDVVYDLNHVIERRCSLVQALVQDSRLSNLSLLSSSQTKDTSSVLPSDLQNIVKQLKHHFDYIFIDCPAGIEQGFLTAMSASDKYILVTTPDVSSIRDADRVLRILEENHRSEPYLLINRYRSEMVKRKLMLSHREIVEILGIPFIGILPETEEILASTNSGFPVAFQTQSSITRFFQHITRRMNGEEVPLVENHTLIQKFLHIVGLSQQRSAL
jgi:septum site-determining protein MinD